VLDILFGEVGLLLIDVVWLILLLLALLAVLMILICLFEDWDCDSTCDYLMGYLLMFGF